MNKLILLLVIGGFASAASAQSPEPVAQSGQPVAKTMEPGAAAIGTKATDTTFGDHNCLRQTGSRITASENRRAKRDGKTQHKCANAMGRAYTRDDIERTGATDVAQALRMLDPAIR